MSRSSRSILAAFEDGLLRRFRDGPFRRDELEDLVDEFMERVRVPEEYFNDLLNYAIKLQEEEFGRYGTDVPSRSRRDDSRGLSTGPSYPSRSRRTTTTARNYPSSRRTSRDTGMETMHSSPYTRKAHGLQDTAPEPRETGSTRNARNTGLYNYIAKEPIEVTSTNIHTINNIEKVFEVGETVSYIFVKGDNKPLDEVEINSMKMAVGKGGGRMGVVSSPDTKFINFWNQAVISGKVGDFETLYELVSKTDTRQVQLVRPYVEAFKRIMEEAIEKKEMAEYRFAVMVTISPDTTIGKEIMENAQYLEDNPIPEDSALFKTISLPGIITHMRVGNDVFRVTRKSDGFSLFHVLSRNAF